MHLGFISRDPNLFRKNEMRMKECFEFYQKEKKKFMVELLYGTPGLLYAFLELQNSYDRI